MASLNLNDGSSGGGSEQDTLAPLPPASANPWPAGGQPYPYPGYPNPPPGFPPGYSEPCHSFHSGSAGSQQSEGRTLYVCASTRKRKLKDKWKLINFWEVAWGGGGVGGGRLKNNVSVVI